jgi:transposase-like protein
MEAEVAELIGAELGERRPEDRATHRNGYRPRRWGHAGGGDRVADPQAASGQLLPELSAAAQAL